MSFEIATGYFAKMKEYINDGYAPVSISRFPPENIRCAKWLTPAPSSALLAGYKAGKIPFDKYDENYLNEIKAKEIGIYDELQALIKELEKRGYKKMVLLCYEKDPASCHRSLFSHYMNRHFNLRIHEVGQEPDITIIQRENDRRLQANEPLITDSFTYLHEKYLSSKIKETMSFDTWMKQKGYELEADHIEDDLVCANDLDVAEITI